MKPDDKPFPTMFTTDLQEDNETSPPDGHRPEVVVDLSRRDLLHHAGPGEGPLVDLPPTPGILATPGHQNASCHANETPGPASTKAEQSPAATEVQKPEALLPGMVATPGYQNATHYADHTVGGSLPEPKVTTASMEFVKPKSSSTTARGGDAPALPPGILATPGYQNASNVSKTSDGPLPGEITQDDLNMPMDGYQEHHAHEQGTSLPTPGMMATPGHHNAIPGEVAQTDFQACDIGRHRLDTPALGIARPSQSPLLLQAGHTDAELKPTNHKRPAPPACDQIGGVMGFETRKKPRCNSRTEGSGAVPLPPKVHIQDWNTAQSRTGVSSADHSLTDTTQNTQKMVLVTTEDAPKRDHITEQAKAEGPSDTLQVWVMHEHAQIPVAVKVPLGTTPADLQKAEDALAGEQDVTCPRTWVNTHMHAQDPLQGDQFIQLSKFRPGQPCKFMKAENSLPAIVLPCARREALWQQQGWVASDEMEFYLQVIAQQGLADVMPVTSFCNDGAAHEEAAVWLHDIFYYLEDHQTCITACIIHHHWVPVMLRREKAIFHMHTTPEGSPLMPAAQELVNWQNMTLRVVQIQLPQAFAADCGFQAFAWLFALTLEIPIEAFPAEEKAEGWRICFAAHLLHEDRHHDVISQLSLGGAQHDKQLQDQVTTLLLDHGVWPDRANERAQQVLAKINHNTLRTILGSNKAWPELKAAANHVSPILKLIMPDELQAQIDARAHKKQKYGKKNASNQRHGSTKTTEPPAINAAELQVPHGVSAQQDGHILGPVRPLDIGPNSKGIVLVDQADSLALRKMQAPVTHQGLAMIVLATKANADAHDIDPTRFPAICVKTEEPIIVSGYVYQLGALEVRRHEPAEKLAVEQIATEAVRCMVFRDQIGPLWDTMQKQPVKTIFGQERILQGSEETKSPIIDVWDSQWLTKRFEKAKPANTDMFAFTFRMASDRYEELLAASSNNGIYYEPRSQCGRKQNDTDHVTWLPGMNFQEAKYAQQTAPQATSLCRHGDRYGLRSDAMNAQTVHDKFRPETPLLLGSKTFYTIGPLPFSTTKEGAAKLLRAWKWDARPLQPKGRTPDSNGIQWAIQAVEDPAFWIYSLQHGDVLITKQQQTKPTAPTGQFAVIASKKTLEHLGSQDPWLQNDPWQRPPAAVPTSSHMPVTQSSLSTPQLAALEASLERKIMNSLQAKMPDGDASMEPSALEDRVQHLEKQLSQVQVSQTGLENRVGQIQTQIEHQGIMFGQALDHKLAEQMDKIESLLTKRSRLE